MRFANRMYKALPSSFVLIIAGCLKEKKGGLRKTFLHTTAISTATFENKPGSDVVAQQPSHDKSIMQ